MYLILAIKILQFFGWYFLACGPAKLGNPPSPSRLRGCNSRQVHRLKNVNKPLYFYFIYAILELLGEGGPSQWMV